MSVIKIEDKEVNEIIKNNNKVLIDCYAEWCGPCKMLSPIVDELAEENTECKFYKIDIDDNEKISQAYTIMSIPTLLYFENGELKNKSVGFKSKEEIIDLMK